MKKGSPPGTGGPRPRVDPLAQCLAFAPPSFRSFQLTAIIEIDGLG